MFTWKRRDGRVNRTSQFSRGGGGARNKTCLHDYYSPCAICGVNITISRLARLQYIIGYCVLFSFINISAVIGHARVNMIKSTRLTLLAMGYFARKSHGGEGEDSRRHQFCARGSSIFAEIRSLTPPSEKICSFNARVLKLHDYEVGNYVYWKDKVRHSIDFECTF